ncbi:MAG: GNAT family N-acetyltransferase [Gammaproteobacteria bacterium]|nr:GNAT family N-acetyltransferase [Gammaproteobacteria bacterium]MBP9729169.1 GNAT family N-acetyltransferase [Gammaproteobacteria bacterium]
MITNPIPIINEFMDINFIPLAESHFPLLLQWLEMPHVKQWWDQDVSYTIQKVQEKYGSYVQEYKSIGGIHKPIRAYIICLNNQPIGYSS